MTKTFCDCCQKEIVGYMGGFTFKYLCHISSENRMLGHVKVIDGRTYEVVGPDVESALNML